MKLLTLLFLSFIYSAHSLEFNDVLPRVNVIKAYDGNFLVLNRGLEDGIFKADHIKLTNQNGYIARAICIKAGMLISHWKVYRVVNPELLSYDDNYKLLSMNQSEIPNELKGFRKADFDEQFNDITDADIKKPIQMQQTRIAKFDLETDVKKDPILKKMDQDATDVFMDRNFNGEQLIDDLSHYEATISMSPISWQTRDDQKSINYGFGIRNNGNKYKFELNYNKTDSKVVDPYSKQEVTSQTANADLLFDIKNISQSTSYFMLLSYYQDQRGVVFNPKNQTQVGILGFKFHLAEPGDTVTQFDFSYITLFENSEREVIDPENNNSDLNSSLIETNQKKTRHALSLQLALQMTDDVKFKNVLWYKPAMKLDSQKIDWQDTQTEWTTILEWNINTKLSASFEHIYSYDILRERDFQIDPMNQSNVINLNYSFTL